MPLPPPPLWRLGSVSPRACGGGGWGGYWAPVLMGEAAGLGEGHLWWGAPRDGGSSLLPCSAPRLCRGMGRRGAGADQPSSTSLQQQRAGSTPGGNAHLCPPLLPPTPRCAPDLAAGFRVQLPVRHCLGRQMCSPRAGAGAPLAACSLLCAGAVQQHGQSGAAVSGCVTCDVAGAGKRVPPPPCVCGPCSRRGGIRRGGGRPRALPGLCVWVCVSVHAHVYPCACPCMCVCELFPG